MTEQNKIDLWPFALSHVAFISIPYQCLTVVCLQLQSIWLPDLLFGPTSTAQPEIPMCQPCSLHNFLGSQCYILVGLILIIHFHKCRILLAKILRYRFAHNFGNCSPVISLVITTSLMIEGWPARGMTEIIRQQENDLIRPMENFNSDLRRNLDLRGRETTQESERETSSHAHESTQESKGSCS